MREDDAYHIKEVQNGKHSEFNEIVLRYQMRVYAMIYRMVHNRSDAEDLTQDTFIHAFRGINRFDLKRPFGPWLYRIALNLTINFLKKRDKYSTVSTDEVIIHSKNPRFDPVKQTKQKMFLERVKENIAKLPKDLKSVLVLRVNEEMSYNEIATTLGISRGTVMSRLSRARHRLRDLVYGRGNA